MARRTIETESARWLNKSAEALRAATHLLEAGDYEFSAHASHQAAELALKALWIVVKRGPPPKTHDLPALARQLTTPDEFLAGLEALTDAYTASRYPSEASYSQATAQHLLEHAQEVTAWTRSQLQRPFETSSTK